MSRDDERPSNFQFQLFLNLDISKSGIKEAEMFCQKWNDDSTCLLVNFTKFDDINREHGDILQFFTKINRYDHLRIYIQAHSDGKSKKLFGANDTPKIEYANHLIANFLAAHFQDLKSSNITVNIIACSYASGIFESPAADLLRQLNNQKINVNVVARTKDVITNGRGKSKIINKLTEDEKGRWINKQPGSKVIFRIKNGYIIAEDAYGIAWKKNVLSGISACADSTLISTKKYNLQIFNNKIWHKNPYEVLKELKEITKPGSFIDQHDDTIFGFFYKTETRKFFDKITESGESILTENSLETITQRL